MLCDLKTRNTITNIAQDNIKLLKNVKVSNLTTLMNNKILN